MSARASFGGFVRAALGVCAASVCAACVQFGWNRTVRDEPIGSEVLARLSVEEGHASELADCLALLGAPTWVWEHEVDGDLGAVLAYGWFDERSLSWATSSAYAQAPVPQVQQFVAAHPIEADLGRSWGRLLPFAEYKYADDAAGERPPRGWTSMFPHTLPGSKTADFYAQWATTRYADAYLTRMAITLTDAFGLGQRSGTDVLAVSFSTLDLAGHSFGPASHEVQDVLAGLDQSLAVLFDYLDTKVGRDRYVVALTADHGVAPVPEQRMAHGATGGRFATTQLRRALESGLGRALGAGEYIEAVAGAYVYLRPGVAARLKATPGALDAVIAAARSVTGIRTVLDTSALTASSPDPIVRAAALGEYAGRSGDLLVVLEPYYQADAMATTHGTPYDYDQRVPVIFMGAGIRPGRYQDAASPADVAPTLGALVGVTLPDADGHPLTSALAAAKTRKAPRAR